MFTTRRKRNYKTFIYAAIIVTLCLLIIVIAWPQNNVSRQDDLQANVQARVDPDNKNPFSDDDKDDIDGDEKEDGDIEGEDNPDKDNNSQFTDNPIDENSNISNSGGTYYLVKRAGDRIKVFFIDEQGNQIELETTQIIYDVLGTEDQKLFDEGYKVESQEELAVLLQDFES